MRTKTKSLTVTKEKTTEKSITNNQKAAKTRRQRGYQWEDTIVKRFNYAENWKAFRLGSPSISLPDVLAVNTNKSTIFTIEAKSGTGTSLPIPADQIERCLTWIKTFDIYKKKQVILAFKFLSKKRIGLREYENRELREFFKIWDESLKITDCVCTYEGRFFAKIDGTRKELFLKECSMPFKTKQRTSAQPN
jgi:Holliday junction resolvase